MKENRMTEKKAGLKTIWFFVGLILLIMGGLVVISGIVQWVNPPASKTVLWELHPALWWGGMMMVIGLVYLITNFKKVVD